MEDKRILIVEDERIIAEDIKRIVQKYNYTVVAIVSSGEEAILAAKRLKPSIILMDIVLRGDMDGIATSRKINEEQRIPIIYITSYLDKTKLRDVKNFASYAYIMKPFEDKELYASIELAQYKFHMETELLETKNKIEKLHAVVKTLVVADSIDDIYDIICKGAENILQFDDIVILRLAENDYEVVRSKNNHYDVGSLIFLPKEIVEEIKQNKSQIYNDKDSLSKRLSIEKNRSMIIMDFGTKDIFFAFSETDERFTANDVNMLGLLLDHATEDIKKITLQDELRKHAIKDSMTNCYNRFYLFTALDRELKKSARNNSTIAFLMIDVNGLKHINDNYGHHVGDELLVVVANILNEASREVDIVVRYGGDEFLVMMPETGEEVEIVVSRIRKKQKLWNDAHRDSKFKVSFAIGYAHWKKDDNMSIEEVLSCADKRMYEDKKNMKQKEINNKVLKV